MLLKKIISKFILRIRNQKKNYFFKIHVLIALLYSHQQKVVEKIVWAFLKIFNTTFLGNNKYASSSNIKLLAMDVGRPTTKV